MPATTLTAATSSAVPALEVHDLTVSYHRKPVLWNVDLAVPPGKLVGIIGKQGGLELEVRDDPMLRLDEFRLMSRPAGRDVTELYAVA